MKSNCLLLSIPKKVHDDYYPDKKALIYVIAQSLPVVAYNSPNSLMVPSAFNIPFELPPLSRSATTPSGPENRIYLA